MNWTDVAQVSSVILTIWLAAVALVILGKVLLDPVQMRGLLATLPAEAGHETQPERAQLVVVFLIAAGVFLAKAIHEIHTGAITAMPEIPNSLLGLLTGSHAFYLTGKLTRIIR